MKALFLEEPGDTPSLSVREVDTPAPGAGEVLLKVSACGLCRHDVAVMGGVLRRGVRPGVVLGHEISGTVAEIGGGVSTVGAGDPIVSALTRFCGECDRCQAGRDYRCREGEGVGHGINGGFAEYVLLPETSVIPLTEGIGLVDAAALACPIGVSFRAVRDVGRVQPGQTVVVTGASGGLGVHAVQIAASMGTRVLAVTGSPDKVEDLERITGAEVILSDELDFSEIVQAVTGDEGADAVIDTVGSATLRSAVRSLGQFGRVVLLGEVEGRRAELNLAEVIFRDATVVGVTGANRADIVSAMAMVADGSIRPVISNRLPLEDAAEAFRLVTERRCIGRVVLEPGG